MGIMPVATHFMMRRAKSCKRPNAEYVAQRREYEDAMHPNERTRATYFPVNYQPLVKSGQMRLLDGDTEIAAGITGHVTRGHTPAHMSIRFESKGEQALFVCDMASYAIHFERLGWMTGCDCRTFRNIGNQTALAKVGVGNRRTVDLLP